MKNYTFNRPIAGWRNARFGKHANSKLCAGHASKRLPVKQPNRAAVALPSLKLRHQLEVK